MVSLERIELPDSCSQGRRAPAGLHADVITRPLPASIDAQVWLLGHAPERHYDHVVGLE